MIVSYNQYRRAETTQLLAYRKPGANGRQQIFHEVFEKLPAVLSELLLQLEASDVLKSYQHPGIHKEMLLVNGSKLRMIAFLENFEEMIRNAYITETI